MGGVFFASLRIDIAVAVAVALHWHWVAAFERIVMHVRDVSTKIGWASSVSFDGEKRLRREGLRAASCIPYTPEKGSECGKENGGSHRETSTILDLTYLNLDDSLLTNIKALPHVPNYHITDPKRPSIHVYM